MKKVKALIMMAIIFILLTSLIILYLGIVKSNNKDGQMKDSQSLNSTNLELGTYENEYATSTVIINDTEIILRIADSFSSREKGLSGFERDLDVDNGINLPRQKQTFGNKDGMIFIFPKEDTLSFWMKDMNFPIDILWLKKAEEGKEESNNDMDGITYEIVDLSENFDPSSYPESISNKELASIVIELPQGLIEELQIEKGDTITLSKDIKI